MCGESSKSKKPLKNNSSFNRRNKSKELKKIGTM